LGLGLGVLGDGGDPAVVRGGGREADGDLSAGLVVVASGGDVLSAGAAVLGVAGAGGGDQARPGERSGEQAPSSAGVGHGRSPCVGGGRGTFGKTLRKTLRKTRRERRDAPLGGDRRRAAGAR